MQTVRIIALLSKPKLVLYRLKLLPIKHKTRIPAANNRAFTHFLNKTRHFCSEMLQPNGPNIFSSWNKFYKLSIFCISLFIIGSIISISDLNTYSQSNQSVPTEELNTLTYTCSNTANDLLNTETQSKCTFPRFDYNSGTLRQFEILLNGKRNTKITLINNAKLSKTLTYYSSAEGLLLWEGIDMNSVELPLGFNTEISPSMPFVSDELITINESRISYTDLDILSLFITSESQNEDIVTTLRISDASSNIEPAFSVSSKDTTTVDVEFTYGYIPNPSIANNLEYTSYKLDKDNLLSIQIPKIFSNSNSTAIITLPQFWSLKPVDNTPTIDDTNYPTYSLALKDNQSELQFQINSGQNTNQNIEVSFLSDNPSTQAQTFIIQTMGMNSSQNNASTSPIDSTIRSGGANHTKVTYLISITLLVVTFALYPLLIRNEQTN